MPSTSRRRSTTTCSPTPARTTAGRPGGPAQAHTADRRWLLCGLLLLPFTVPPACAGRRRAACAATGGRRSCRRPVVVYLVIVSTSGGRALFALQPLGILSRILLIVIAVSWDSRRAIWHWHLLDRVFGPPKVGRWGGGGVGPAGFGGAAAASVGCSGAELAGAGAAGPGTGARLGPE